MAAVLRLENMKCECGYAEKDVLIERYVNSAGKGTHWEEVLCPVCGRQMERDTNRTFTKHGSWSLWNDHNRVG